MSFIDESLQRREENRKIRAPGVLYVTDLTGPCLRNAYFGITLDKPYPVETLRVFNAGNLLEDYWLNLLHENKDYQVLAAQLPVRLKTEAYEIHGRLDALVQHGDGALYVHEVKTAKSLYYTREPKPEHEAQFQFYMNRLGVEHGELDYLDKGVLLQGGKPDDVPEKRFTVRRNNNAYVALLVRAKKLSRAWKKKEVPACKKGWLCNYCLARRECEEFEEEAEK